MKSWVRTGQCCQDEGDSIVAAACHCMEQHCDDSSSKGSIPRSCWCRWWTSCPIQQQACWQQSCQRPPRCSHGQGEQSWPCGLHPSDPHLQHTCSVSCRRSRDCTCTSGAVERVLHGQDGMQHRYNISAAAMHSMVLRICCSLKQSGSSQPLQTNTASRVHHI